jgi:hypothetical protein
MGASMRDGHLLCLTGLLVVSVTAVAQPVPQSPHVDSANTQGADYEIAGCLRSSNNGASNATQSSVVYTLQERTNPNAKAPAATSGTAVVETSPKRNAATTMPPDSTYTLSAPASVGLANHVGHKVLLTGHLQANGGDANAPASPAPSSTTTHPAPPGGAHRTLQISALKMISTTCE